jgi:hypothetical protein
MIGRFSLNNRILRPINGLRHTRQPSCIIRASYRHFEAFHLGLLEQLPGPLAERTFRSSAIGPPAAAYRPWHRSFWVCCHDPTKERLKTIPSLPAKSRRRNVLAAGAAGCARRLRWQCRQAASWTAAVTHSSSFNISPHEDLVRSPSTILL